MFNTLSEVVNLSLSFSLSLSCSFSFILIDSGSASVSGRGNGSEMGSGSDEGCVRRFTVVVFDLSEGSWVGILCVAVAVVVNVTEMLPRVESKQEIFGPWTSSGILPTQTLVSLTLML